MKGQNRALAHDLADILPAPAGTPFRRLRMLAAMAFTVVGVFVIGFGLWAAYAPLESAAVAGAIIEAESSRKTIQHLEGGIIARILVDDGDKVVAGQSLIRLDDTKARATVQILQAQLGEAQALEARLMAERDAREAIQFPPALVAAAQRDPALAEAMAGQIKIFGTLRSLQSSQIQVIEQRKAQSREEIAALGSQVRAATRLTEIVEKELAAVTPLVVKGLLTRARQLKIEREQAEFDGRLGDAQAQISRAEQAIGESEARILQLKSDRHTEVAQGLRDTQAQIFQLIERLQAANDVLDRTVVRAPQAGTITDLRIRTLGGVVVAGEPLMDLVPRHDRLIALAQVKPEDIDLVHPGLEARVRLLAYKNRRVPPVDGVLIYVSADRHFDKETEQAYYIARVQINEDSLNRLPDVQIMPGMPAEVLIKTGQFTVAHYALRPFLESFNRAFRED